MYLIDILFEVGPTEISGMGEGPVSFQSLYYWQRLMGISLSAWEVRLLRRLSTLYLSERSKGESPTSPRPWVDASPEKSEERSAAVSSAVGSIFGRAKKEK